MMDETKEILELYDAHSIVEYALLKCADMKTKTQILDYLDKLRINLRDEKHSVMAGSGL